MQPVLDPAVAISWLLFLALFPMAFIWLRRAWRIFGQKDYGEVALKGGLPPARPENYALPAGMINLLAGAIALWIVVGVPLYIATGLLVGPFPRYETWSALAGTTIWGKLLADFLLSRYAHPFGPVGKKGPPGG